MPIVFHCPLCSHRLRVADDSGGKRGKCPACAAPVMVPLASEDSTTMPIPLAPASGSMPDGDGDGAGLVSSPATATATEPAPAVLVTPSYVPPAPVALHPLPPAGPLRVVVTDLDMPFASMVGFMVKWSLAAIPAMLFLAFIMGLIGLVLSIVGASLFRGVIST